MLARIVKAEQRKTTKISFMIFFIAIEKLAVV